ncbi:hypothetical protein ABIF65_002490 [Bradyrhizobium japonicum]|uniref:hypothetical protein n=1 Tax=Bradyrhizobium japonicum TaxID=375 RepID=UPI000487A377|nr:hypothetical protein [Bradyrhizobium japonicum]MCP1742351.1 hypothetical protein [Bradyrhizobium japonicum]MCP1780715.1 hypothetical protein [Bradyrhizobium japonicum]MCP1860062.1 hypothetical protein [Bradyrhizobium japonicum]MCP1890828.1 hypothetical protein [Bradyrhizobium japonicum]MCP1956292.1 hypothetical protein [Bradyrhizobium japonicum]
MRGDELRQRGQDLVANDLVRVFAAIGEQDEADLPDRDEAEIAGGIVEAAGLSTMVASGR